MKYIYISLILFSTILSSCDDYVDIEPKRLAIAESYNDVNAMLDAGVDLSDASGCFTSSQLINDNVFVDDSHLQSLNSDTRKSHIFSIYNLEDRFYLDSEVDYNWNKSYEVIATCNYILQVLDGLDKNDPKNDQYRGEALVHRSYLYWVLINTYANHYGTSFTDMENSGIPFLTKHADETNSLKRRTIKEVYSFIVEDLESAIDYLPTDRMFKDRPHKAAAQGMLARVYLHMGNYAKALEYANDALQTNSSLNNYSTIVGILPESIDNPENVLTKKGEVPYVNINWTYFNYLTVSKDLEAIYDTDNDLRIVNHTAKNELGYYSYASNVRYGYYLELGVTVPELILIKAEALARDANTWDSAMSVLNELRVNRFSIESISDESYKLIADSQEKAIENVINERRREFHVSGMRFFDIKRLNALHDANISLVRKDVTWTPNSINWALPITDKIIRTSSDMIAPNPRE